VIARIVRISSLSAAAAVLLVLFSAGSVRAEGSYWTTKKLLKDFFKTSERVTYVAVSRGELAKFGNRTGARDRYVVFVATTAWRVDGYAVIDDEKGQHQPITFGVQLDAEGRVLRTEVMAYREGYGEEIREGRFQKQYRGKGPGDSLRFGRDVVAISGATISSRAMTVAVARAVKLVEAARGKQGPRSAALATGGR